MARRVFYSFHYKPDSWRAAMVRQIGAISGNEPVSDNGWETIKKSGNAAIERWITNEMKGRSCTVVLVGARTAGRRWIKYEIAKSWSDGMGVVGIRINGLKNSKGFISQEGSNPFTDTELSVSGKRLSTIVKCYTPRGSNSKARYKWISDNLETLIEEAIAIRNTH